jgi:tetratricopeptide (TPR) repeat protein
MGSVITAPVPQTNLSAQDAAAQAANNANLAASAASSIMSFIQTTGTILGLLLIGGIVSTFGYVLNVVSKYEKDLNELKRQSANSLQVQTLLQLSQQQIEFKNDNAAIDALEHAQKLDAKHPVVNYFLGELYLREYQQGNRLEEAIQSLEYALTPTETYDRYPSAEAALAYAYRLQGEDYGLNTKEGRDYFRKAEKMFKKALDENPGLRGINGEPWVGALGSLYRKMGDNRRAIECYKQGSAMSPDRSYPLNNIAILYYMENDERNGREYFERAKRIAKRQLDGDPSYIFARFDMLTAHIAMNEAEAAEGTYQRLLEDHPNKEALTKLRSGLMALRNSQVEIPLLEDYLNRIDQDSSKL